MLLDHLQNVGTKAQVSAPDGTLDYGALAQLVRVVAEQLPTDRADQCLGLPSSNSLVALATLVACIEAGQSFALAPHDAGPEDFPPFCAAWLQAGGSPDTPKLGVHPIDGRTPCKVTRGQFYAASSGSTGAPKWIIHTARGLIDNTAGCAARLGLGPDHRVMIPVPIHHMFGLGPALMANLQAGSTIHLVQRGNPLDIFAGERDFDPTTTFFVPSQCRSLLAMRRQVRLYRMIVVAGDYLSPEQARTFEAKNGPIVGLYGSSELGVVAAGRPNDPVSVRDGYTGPLLPDATPCGPREDLEQEHQIFLRSTSGYLGYADPQGGIGIPAQACFDTGDLGRFDAEGRIQIVGRASNAVKRDGLFVHLTDIETCLCQADGVNEAVVVPAGETRRGVGLTAFVVGRGLSPQALIAHCARTLETRAVPDAIVPVRSLPMLASGKADRKALSARAAEMQ